MASSSSSQFGILLVVSISSLMLMMAPHSGSALECYMANLPEYRGRGAALDLGNLLQAETEVLIFLTMPTNGNGSQTMQCRAEYKYCATIRCPKISKKVFKGCQAIPRAYTPETLCEAYRTKLCGDEDGKFYCRHCQTDKCNNEPIED